MKRRNWQHWSKWLPATLSPQQEMLLRRIRQRLPDRIFVNNLYEVWLTDVPAGSHAEGGDGWPAMVWLSIKRRDKAIIRDWRHLQRIKNELVGPEHEGIELFPAESRLVDAANQYHLWVFADAAVRLPLGFGRRLVHDPLLTGGPVTDADALAKDPLVAAALAKSKQRPMEVTA